MHFKSLQLNLFIYLYIFFPIPLQQIFFLSTHSCIKLCMQQQQQRPCFIVDKLQLLLLLLFTGAQIVGWWWWRWPRSCISAHRHRAGMNEWLAGWLLDEKQFLLQLEFEKCYLLYDIFKIFKHNFFCHWFYYSLA